MTNEQLTALIASCSGDFEKIQAVLAGLKNDSPNEIVEKTEIVEDMPDFDEETTESPAEGEESVDNCTAESESAIVSEENVEETEETAGETEDEESTGSAEDKTEGKDTEKKEKKPKELNPYEKAILAEMQRRADNGDTLLADAMKSKDKTIQECFRYVTEQARKRSRNGCAMIEDAVVFGWAHHYYIESKETIDKELKPKQSFKYTAPNNATANATAKKGAEKPKPVKNVLDISKAIVSATKPKEDGKKAKREKKKDNLLAGFVPMERPNLETYEKDGKKGSREQAKSVTQMDLFADFFAD